MYAVGSVCTSGLPGIQMSPEEQEKCLAMRREAFRKYRVLAITTTALSVVSITIGIVILVLAKGGGFPLTSGVPIWAGAIILVGSGFGIALGFSNPEWKTDGDKNRQRCFVMVYYIMAVTSFSCVGLCIGYSAWSLAECVNKDDDNKICPTNFDVLTALNAIAMIIAFIFFICSMCVAIMFCYYRKAFHFQSRQDRAAAIQRVLIEQQQQIAVLQRQQQSQMGPNPPQYQYTQNQGMGYGATHYGSEYGTKYSSPPPSYFSSASGNKI